MTSKSELNKAGKFLSYVLRHRPDDIGLVLDDNGWADIDELITKAKPQITLSYELIEQVVVSNDKQRFKIADNKQQIRANQGHSVKVDLKLDAQKPPPVLYHGTAQRFLESIKQQGLKPDQRHHVHLSTDIVTAKAVGRRYGKPVILTVDSQNMVKQGHLFYVSDNNVWLTDAVPPEFLMTGVED